MIFAHTIDLLLTGRKFQTLRLAYAVRKIEKEMNRLAKEGAQ